jgi:hypothetical protein
LKQEFSRVGGNSCLLKLPDFTSLPVNLGTHSLNFGPDVIKLHGVLVQLSFFNQPENNRGRASFPF